MSRDIRAGMRVWVYGSPIGGERERAVVVAIERRYREAALCEVELADGTLTHGWVPYSGRIVRSCRRCREPIDGGELHLTDDGYVCRACVTPADYAADQADIEELSRPRPTIADRLRATRARRAAHARGVVDACMVTGTVRSA